MSAERVLRFAVLIVSSAAVIVGVLVVAGVLVPRNFPGQFRIPLGVVVALYGLHRFVVTYYRRRRQ